MEATVVLITPTHLLAACPEYGSERIFVHRHAATFELSDVFKGDMIALEDVTDQGRGPRASRATWVSRGKDLVSFTGTVVRVNHDRGFSFVSPDAGGDDLFCHAQDFLDYRKGASVTFNGLINGDRVTGFQHDDRPNPRGVRLDRI